MIDVAKGTGIDVGRRAGADAVLAATLLVVVVVLGVVARSRPDPTAIVAGAGLTLAAEALAYQRPQLVERLWTSQPVRVVAILATLAAITASALTAPDRGLSLAAGALATYLLLFGAGRVVGTPDGVSGGGSS